MNIKELRKGNLINLYEKNFLVLDIQFINDNQEFAILNLKELGTNKAITFKYPLNKDIILANWEEDIGTLILDENNNLFFSLNDKRKLLIENSILEDKILFLEKNKNYHIKFVGRVVFDIDIPQEIILQVKKIKKLKKFDFEGFVFAEFESGLMITVPTEIQKNDMVKINTLTGKFIEKVN